MMDHDEGSSTEQDWPEINAKVSGKNILLKVHCVKQKGVLAKILGRVESLNLLVVNTNVTTFGDLALDITIIAEMEKEFSSTVKEVVTSLRAALH